SMAILTKEFVKLYDGQELKKQRLQYKDYSEWQNEFLKSDKIIEHEKYWIEQFSDEIPVLNLPLDYVRSAVHSFEGGSLEFGLGWELTEKLRLLSRETGTTLYMVLLSAIDILLSKYTGQEDIIVGSAIAGRPHADLEGIIGMFVNTLVMRSYPASGKTYNEFLNEVKETTLKAYENQDYQFEELIDRLNLSREISRNPLFDVMFVLQNMENSELEIESLKMTSYNSVQNPARFDLTFTAIEVGGEIEFSVEYCKNLFKSETIERMTVHFQNLLNAIVENTSSLLGDIDILPGEERNRLLYDFNDTVVEYPRDRTIHQLFEEQTARTPDNVALVLGDESMTYADLNAKANQLARVLRANGLKPNSLAVIMVERSFAMVVGILGILKAGGAYVPIDPKYPEDRIKFTLKDSGAEILLTHSWLSEKIEFEGAKINLDNAQFYDDETDDLEIVNSSNDLAYVIYTSGSTGVPKGVMVEHGSIINTLLWRKGYYGFNDKDVTLQIPSYTFDSSAADIFTSLISGSSLILIDQNKRLDISYLKNTIIKNGVTNFLITPAFYNSLLEGDLGDIEALRVITVAGESIRESVLRKHFETFKDVRIINEYGPTENSVCTTVYEIEDKESEVLIGKPISNISLYILGKHGSLSLIGVPGELCIGGIGLAQGYLNRPELTAEKFVPNPFIPGERMYRTGDLVRWLPDGNIEFLDRI
ncbi:MAG: non-ribosomal peptide synthetase, partial [Bacillota bacterium]